MGGTNGGGPPPPPLLSINVSSSSSSSSSLGKLRREPSQRHNQMQLLMQSRDELAQSHAGKGVPGVRRKKKRKKL